MQSIAVLFAFVAVCSAGGLNGYTSSNYVQHAHVAQAHHVAPVAVAQPAFATYAQGPVAYAHQAAPVAYAHAPVIAKTVVPAAQSYAYNNRAPAAKLAVAAPVYAHGPAYAAAPAFAHGPAYAAAPAFAHGPAYAAGPAFY